MHKMTFFPLGNADCCLIELACGKKLLWDFAAVANPDDDDDLRCDLPALLKRDLKAAGRDYYDVVAFSHLDTDHFRGATEFFHLWHAQKYQTEGRIKMPLMWVPAALVTETGLDDDEARVLQKEARHRFKLGKGIRVFSRPERLRKWCEKNDVKLEDRLELITDAGRIAPEFSLATDDVEVFVHSPFAVRQDANNVEDRNGDSIVVQVVFRVDGVDTKALLLADATHDAIADIVNITKKKRNNHRLEWDIAKLPHHCSYLSLATDKGDDETTPVAQATWLFSKQGSSCAIAVSTSKPIPIAGSASDREPQPPHRQAAAYYRRALTGVSGQFTVTMEHPSKRAPAPLVIEIGRSKATLKKTSPSGAAVVTTRRAPRAG